MENGGINMCNHKWKKTGGYVYQGWDGYAVDAVYFEEWIDEYTCEICGETKEE